MNFASDNTAGIAPVIVDAIVEANRGFARGYGGDDWTQRAERRHANAMADRLADGLRAAGLEPVWPVEANLVFIVLPRALDAKLRAAGANYYVRPSASLEVGPDNVLVRLVTSFATADEDIERFVGLCKKS